MKYCINTLNNLNILLHNLTVYSTGNTHNNFDKKNRHKTHNVYFTLLSVLSKEIEGIGCPPYILHNTAFTSPDVLSVSMESIVLKSYKYFSIFTVRN